MPSHLRSTPQRFIREALRFGSSSFSRGEASLRRYRALFGVTPHITSVLWNRLLQRLPSKSEPRHLLWSLPFLKLYDSEHVHACLTGVSEKTFRKWCWVFVKLLSELEVVKWDDRLAGREASPLKVSVDGTDFRIQEPVPFSPSWYSHKFKAAGLRYEIAVSVKGGNIVWGHGPFPCGSYNDLRIYRLGLKNYLMRDERVIADGGYQDPTCS